VTRDNLKSPFRGITGPRATFIISRSDDLIRNREGTEMLQWRNGRLVGVLIALVALATAIGNWGWDSFTWGW
jgi:hypothetical protein